MFLAYLFWVFRGPSYQKEYIGFVVMLSVQATENDMKTSFKFYEVKL
jgi:hypothetical protein